MDNETIADEIARRALRQGVLTVYSPLLTFDKEPSWRGLFINPVQNSHVAHQWDELSKSLQREGLQLKHFTESVDARRYLVIMDTAKKIKPPRRFLTWVRRFM